MIFLLGVVLVKLLEEVSIDELDRMILRELQINARISNAEIARVVHLSPPAVHARIRRLEETGLIAKYTALLDREKAGFDMLCFIHIGLQLHQANQVDGVRAKLASFPEVLECYHVTGEYDYLLKVVVRGRKDLQRLVSLLTPVPGIGRIHTSLVLTDVKNESALPLVH
jgi:DNA-binding Lrp family transcriptional regulator